jgi:hypothetical protein
VRSNDAIEIENIVGKMIIAPRPHPAAIAVAAAVRGDHADVSLLPKQCIDESSPTVRKVKITVHQD